jgi:nucleoside-triphosphatase THEP1
MNKTNKLNEKWIKASILGTIWAAFEIVLGSFLHNFKIPFSSNALTAIGIVILISVSYIWTEKGLFWRAGIICAIMKTMSPSAVIFGPMVAIFFEAALLEVSVRLFGRTIFGFVVGAMLSMSWNLFQKILNFILFYGFNIVEVYTKLVKYAQKQLSLDFDLVWLPILVLFGVYCFLGLLSAIVAIKIGRKLIIQQHTNQLDNKQYFSEGKQNGLKPEFNYSIYWLIFNTIAIIAPLILLNFTSWNYWIPCIILIVLIWIVRYKRALNQLSRPRFWIYFALITMVTAFVFTKMESKSFEQGLLIGIQMNFRAVIIILGFSVLGTELYNPAIRAFFLRTSFQQLPLALELSFESLPSIVSNIPDFKVFIKNPVSIISNVISQAELRLGEIRKKSSKKIFVISGQVGSGKTAHVQKIIEALKGYNISVGGLYCPRILDGETTIGYDVVDIQTNEQIEFLRKSKDDTLTKIGRYSILPKGLEVGRSALDISKNRNWQLIVIDEVGNLELENRGWASTIDELLKVPTIHLLFTVRDIYVERIIQKWNLGGYTLFKITETEETKISELIKRQIISQI